MKLYFKQIITLTTIVAFSIVGFAAFANNSDTNELSDFLFVVDVTNDQIILSCKKGCAWTELSFNTSINDNFQAVDQFGMTDETRKNIEGNSDPSEFLFKIRKTQDGVSLKGEKGSAWTNLSFSCPAFNCGQAVDQHGMTRLESK